MHRRFSVWKKIVFFAMPLSVVMLARTSSAALDYLVILKDGSAYQGDLVEYAPGDHVTIHLATGETRRFAWSDISMPTVPPTPLPTSPPPADPIPPPATDPPTPLPPPPTPDLTSNDSLLLTWESHVKDRVSTQPEVPTNLGPKAGQWMLDVRMPMSVTMSDPSLSMEMLGLDLGTGTRITDGVYLGAFAGLTQSWDLSGGAPLMYARTHAGGELQFVTHRGSTLNDDGTSTPTGSYQWIGFRGGAEGVRSVSPTGGFAELEYGFGNAGVVLGAGVSFEPPGIFGSSTNIDSTPSPPPTRTLSPFLSIAFRFGVGG